MLCWNHVLTNNRNKEAVVDFVEDNVNFRTLQRQLTTEARREIVNGGRTADELRVLARKALRRRNIRYTLSV